MSQRPDQRPLAIVSACMTAQGLPEFVLTTVEVTQAQIENGVHYYLAEGELLERGYEEPFVHFDESESPPFLHAAVRDYLCSSSPTSNPSEIRTCRV